MIKRSKWVCSSTLSFGSLSRSLSGKGWGEVYSVLGTGCNNSTNSACYGTILNGANNTVSGNYSAILGGSGNNDNGLNYAGIFGCNIIANTTKAFHANNFMAQNMPAFSTGIPGVFYIHSSGGINYVAIT